MGKTKIDFIGKRKISFLVSSVIAVVGLLAIAQIVLGTANLGTDFTGGTVLQLLFVKQMDMQAARQALSRNGITADLQQISGSNQLLVKIGKTSLALGKVASTVEEIFRKEFPSNSFTVESSSEIGPSIGDKLRKDTLIAVLISMIGIILYIAWRFDFKFGVAAAIATFHDVLAIFAVFFVLNKEVNLLLITAVLTIAGYSLTDTVVVFDRIRENLRKNMKDSLPTIFNVSINEVLSRTIITALTTLLAALSLFLFGGEVIHDFAFALVVGILVGTYSSVFVASPLVLVWENRTKRRTA
ncbi:MAG: protein translocase subunit SecF [Geobacteraceae bacterium]|nr:protein translocase subunit SecF [Geobacteraceae bacterium]